MPEKTIKRRLTEAGSRELADDGPIFSTVAKLVDALQRAVPHSRDLELREEALRLDIKISIRRAFLPHTSGFSIRPDEWRPPSVGPFPF